MSGREEGEADTGSRVALVGMAGRFAGAADVDELWRNLRSSVDSIERYEEGPLLEASVSRTLLEDPSYVRAGAPLPNMEKFDAEFFGFSPLDAAIMDPQHRHFLECCWEAFEHASIDPARFQGSVGVFAGCGYGGYLAQNLLTNSQLVDEVGFFLLRHTSNDKDFLATRVSYELDLKGPSINVQTACSTSLVAVHLACQGLFNGECDLAIAGGATIELPHRQGYLYRDGEILSPDGRCRPFDAKAAGTVFGSGVGVVLLRRLEDALADGDPILAVVLGSAVNNDGSSKVGYLAPSVDGQAAAVTEALAVAGVDPRSIRFIECHGTGTPLGDPIEVAALTQAFPQEPGERGHCALGSLKANIGHTDTAAGVAGLIKAVQALRHREIPPTLHFESPNPDLGLEESSFYVNREIEPWVSDGPRRAGVCSLGVGGTNAHVILEEAATRPASGKSRAAQLVLLSGRSDGVVQRASDRLADHLREHPELELADVAHTLRVGRRHFRQRRALVCRDADAAVQLLEEQPQSERIVGTAAERPPSLAFLFPGGGAQYPGMGRELYEHEPYFRERVDECLDLLGPSEGDGIRRVLFPPPEGHEEAAREFERPSLQLPALFIVEYALARLLVHWGLQPKAVAGHSVGENTAACVVGVFQLRDALGLVSLRGRLFEQVPAGTMLSIPLPAEDVTSLLDGELQLASDNAPELSVASGPIAAIERLEGVLEARGVESRRIKIRIAAHSAMLDPILPEWRAYLESIELSPPRIPIVSNHTGTWLSDDEATDPEYWVRHLRNSVLFRDDLSTLFEDPERLLLEVGPGRTLATLARMHPGCPRPGAALTSLPHPEQADSDLDFVLATLGRLWTAGADPNWDAFVESEERARVELPAYPWQHQRHWIEPGAAAGPSAEAGPVQREDDVRRWFQTVAWRRSPRPPAASAGSVLAFTDDGSLAGAAVAALRGAGRRVLEVREGARFQVEGSDGYRLRPGEPADYEALLEALDSLPGDLVHFWNLGASGRADAHAAEATRAFFSLLALAKALGNQDVTESLRLHVVTDSVHGVGGEAPGPSVQALSLGPCRVIPSEYPNVRCRNLDVVSSAMAAEELSRLLAAEIGDLPDDVVALRGRERLVPVFAPSPVHDVAPNRSALREGGVYLITGGLGGLGLELAKHLARNAGARLALVSRRRLPPRDEWPSRLERDDSVADCLRALLEIEEAGGEFETYAADVCDANALRGVLEAVRDRFGALHGVVHTAGTLNDSLIQFKSSEEAQRVLAPKVAGTLALDAALEGSDIDFLWLYSSVSAWAGLPGQVDYAAANAFLDAFARERSARPTAGDTVSIAWGAWREVGIAAELARRVEGGGSTERELDHPWLHRLRSERGDTELYTAELAPADHWILDEHRLNGDPLLPGTGYLELAYAALAAKSATLPFELRGVLLLSPFRVDDGERRELWVRYQRGSGEFAMASPIPEEAGGGFVEHARGTVTALPDEPAPTPRSLTEIRERCSQELLDGNKAPKSAHLRFGPRWDCVRRVGFGSGEAFADLELGEAFRGDLTRQALHPALLDMATGCAHALIEGHDPKKHFFVPISYGRVLVRGALPERFHSHLRLRAEAGGVEDFAIFDVDVLDEEGRVLVAIEELVLKRVRQEDTLATEIQPLADATEFAGATVAADGGLVDDLRTAIRPAEGMEAVSLLLGSGLEGHVFVTPHPLGPWLEHLASRTGAPVPAVERLDPATLAEIRQVEAAVRDAQGVADAVVTVHFDRPGERRLLAHVVWEPEHIGTVSELRRTLRKYLSDDLVPQNFVELDSLPRTSGGEVDTEALEDPFGVSDDYVAPQTSTQKTVARVWKQALGIDRVGLHDNFFDIGGHSLLAMRAIVRLDKELGVRLNTAIMVLQTLEQIAAECDRRLGSSPSEAGEQEASEKTAAAPGASGLSGRLLRAVKRGVGDRGGEE
jgi:acyl transferase domain-containing protein